MLRREAVADVAYGIKRCLGCGELGRWDSTGRCAMCGRVHKAKYHALYRAARKRWARIIAERTVTVLCPRCMEPITGAFDLGHQANGTLHPEHPRCNRGARPAKSRTVAR
jgi:hypothetical protein